MKVYEKKYIILEIDEGSNCLIQHWKGLATSEEFRDGIEKSIMLFKEKRFTKLISNTRDSGIVKKEDTDWVATYATPLMASCGLKYLAFIVPLNIFTKLSVDNFKDKVDSAVEIQYFDELEKAKWWLKNC